MGNMNSMTFILCLQAVLIAISIPASLSRTIHPNGEYLIEQTCKSTPNYSLCIQLLKSDPLSSQVNTRGLAQIMVRAIESNANQTLVKIDLLLQGSPDPKQKNALNECAIQYKVKILADVASAFEALAESDTEVAENEVGDVLVNANACEKGFCGNSPLTQQNKYICDVANVARAIIKNNFL